MDKTVDPILLEVIKNRMTSLTEEMGAVLMRTAFSPNIKERRDFSCALFNAQGEMVAQAAHIPVHLGSMPLSVAAALKSDNLQPGDMLILNDPYCGGTHLPDVTLVMPVFYSGQDQPAYYLANRAHHADIGGMQPGSLPLSTEIFQEGLRIPPVKLVQAGQLNREFLSLLMANVRTPTEREGDLMAQVAANRVGERRLLEMMSHFGFAKTQSYSAALLDYGAEWTRRVIKSLPDGDYQFSDQLDSDGQSSEPIMINCNLKIDGAMALVDFTESDSQGPGCLNAVRAVTLSAVAYVFRLLTPDDVPYNSGSMRPVTVTTRPGTIVDCCFPAAVAGGNVETSQRIVDVLMGALSKALPERIPAASGGSMNNLLIGGTDPRNGQLFAYYETTACGAGGGPEGDGASGLQTHMTNTLNTPVEALEHAYPLLVRCYCLRQGSGGEGQFAGGEGVLREVELTGPALVTLLTERRNSAPYGLYGGQPGRPGRNCLIRNAEQQILPDKAMISCRAGDRLRIETPGGGGWGKPKDGRCEETVLRRDGGA
ncbi:MAG: hydantoinase B/oxoprolinase family protein [Deltaproteobacteria bacterium]|jgi:N-methylhydantoinase B|nr:hydantoinase B/oxoprolinase family protein [Deltaproteobacteria bacterium]